MINQLIHFILESPSVSNQALLEPFEEGLMEGIIDLKDAATVETPNFETSKHQNIELRVIRSRHPEPSARLGVVVPQAT